MTTNIQTSRRRLAALGTTGVLLMTSGLATGVSIAADDITERIHRSPQWSDGAFRNPDGNLETSPSNMFSAGWKFLFSRNDRTPDSTLPTQPVNLAAFTSRGADQLNATWLGHSSLLINVDGLRIATDPVFQKRISLFGPSRYNGDIPLSIDSLPELDVVIISHNHYDHLNKYTLERIHSRVTRFVTVLGVGAILIDCGVPAEKIIELDWWEECTIDSLHTIVATPAQHFSGRGLTDRNETLWGSWVIRGPQHTVFYGGDSGYFSGFADIGAQYGPFDITFLECGAYNERWRSIHMFPEETIQAHLDLQGKVLHPIHWGTFNLSLHPWYDPMIRAAKAADSAGIRIATPIPGETTIPGSYLPTTPWWEPFLPVTGTD